MSAKDVTDDLVRQVTDHLRDRYALDDEALQTLGARLADDPERRRAENIAFAEGFASAHRETFDRLAR